MIIKTLISSNQELTLDIFLASGVTYNSNWQKKLDKTTMRTAAKLCGKGL